MPDTYEPAANMFDPVCRVVHKSIEQDIFPRFKHSTYAKELLAKIPSLAKRLGSSGSNSNTNQSNRSSGR